jgi:hypothetical protein
LKVEAVTTFTEKGYEVHAEKFLDSWAKWGIPIHCYEEPLLNIRAEPYIYEYDLEQESPELVAFKEDYGQYNGRRLNTYNYVFDAVKWSHRIFALAAQARKSEADILINIDSDIVVFDTPPETFVEDLLGDADIAYMPRKQMYSECSFVAYRLNPMVKDFIADHERMYIGGLIFDIRNGWTDCHAFDVLIETYKRHGLKTKNINEGIPDSIHPFVNGPLGSYMDHLKGGRKREGKSRKADLLVRREESYWCG